MAAKTSIKIGAAMGDGNRDDRIWTFVRAFAIAFVVLVVILYLAPETRELFPDWIGDWFREW